MMTSSNGNIFRVTGHLCGEFTGHRLINGWVNNREAADLRRRRTLYDVMTRRSVGKSSTFHFRCLFLWVISNYHFLTRWRHLRLIWPFAANINQFLSAGDKAINVQVGMKHCYKHILQLQIYIMIRVRTKAWVVIATYLYIKSKLVVYANAKSCVVV